MRRLTRFAAIGLTVLLLLVQVARRAAADGEGGSWVRGDLVTCQHGAVVCVSPPACEVGVRVLQQGGTAVDAAVATAFALAVTWPGAGNIGGGGYMVVVPAGQRGRPVVVDFREIAPAAATRDMFVKKHDRTAHRRVGVPGTVRGLGLAHQRYGRLPWKSLVMPAIALARNGFALDAATAASLNEVLAEVDPAEFGEFQRVYSKPNGKAWRDGDRLEQSDMATTLERIATDGADAFYEGIIASQIAAEMLHGGGLITQADLEGYRAKYREPIRGSYRGFEIIAAPPSTSGGTTLTEMLNILENFDLRSHGRFAPETLHLMVEAARRAYRDRARYLGDPDVVPIPETLTRKDYARTLAAGIDLRRATRSRSLAGDMPISETGAHTTHLSVIDSEGTAVSMTYTLENMYGSRVVVRGAGFLLNDEMNDFNWLPGVTDESGRIGTPPNEVVPGKRMLSSMCPTVLLRDGKPYLITGSPGGRTIINTVLDMVINVVDFQMQPRAAVDAPRMHHQWFPDRVRIERRLANDYPAAITGLRAMGHDVQVEKDTQGDAHSIWFDSRTGRITAVADKRENGCAGGY